MNLAAASIATLLLATQTALPEESITITNWAHYNAKQTAIPAKPQITSPSISLSNTSKSDNAYIASFTPVPLQAGKSITFSSRLYIPSDFPESGNGQIRIGLYGVTAGARPDTTDYADLRGFVVNVGSMKSNHHISLQEHASAEGPLILLAGLSNHATAQSGTTFPRGAENRLVITLTKKSPEAMTISGFWADAPFTFDIKPLAGDYTHLRALILFRGQISGANEMKFSNVKIRSD